MVTSDDWDPAEGVLAKSSPSKCMPQKGPEGPHFLDALLVGSISLQKGRSGPHLPLPPLASMLAAAAGPTASSRLGFCSTACYFSMPTGLRGDPLRHWCLEYWSLQAKQAACSPPFRNGRVDDHKVGTSPTESTWPRSPRSFVELLDRAFIATAQDPQILRYPDAQGLSPLHVAARRRCPQLVDLLLKLGADPNISSVMDERTPLHQAAAAKDERCIKFLLEAKADPCRRDILNMMAQDVAARVQAEACQELLLASLQDTEEAATCTSGIRQACVIA